MRIAGHAAIASALVACSSQLNDPGCGPIDFGPDATEDAGRNCTGSRDCPGLQACCRIYPEGTEGVCSSDPCQGDQFCLGGAECKASEYCGLEIFRSGTICSSPGICRGVCTPCPDSGPPIATSCVKNVVGISLEASDRRVDAPTTAFDATVDVQTTALDASAEVGPRDVALDAEPQFDGTEDVVEGGAEDSPNEAIVTPSDGPISN